MLPETAARALVQRDQDVRRCLRTRVTPRLRQTERYRRTIDVALQTEQPAGCEQREIARRRMRERTCLAERCNGRVDEIGV
jgi:hypothetical protein